MARFSWPIMALAALMLAVCVSISTAQSDACSADLASITAGTYVSKVISVQMADATGKGIDDLGNLNECAALGSVARYAAVEMFPLTVNHTLATTIPYFFGMCAPISCSDDDIKAYAMEAAMILTKGQTDRFFLNVVNPTEEKNYSGSYWGSMFYIIVICCLGSAGCIIDFWRRPPPPMAGDAVPVDVMIDASAAMEREGLIKKNFPNSEGSSLLPTSEDEESSRFIQFVQAFNFYRNFKSLCSTTPGPLNCTNGIRALSMLWVILGHTSEFMSYSMENLPYVTYNLETRFFFAIMPAAYYAVDSFFFLSGFLTAYLLLKELRQKSGRVNWVMFYIHRWIRLVPTYAFAVMIYVNILPTFGSGLAWEQQKNFIDDRCGGTKWWPNFLFINNFTPSNFANQCMGWSWYMANDMQFYVICPLLVFTYYKSKKAGNVLLAGLLAVSVAINIFLVGHNDLNANPTAPYGPEYMRIVYGKPYCRVGTYLIGVAAAYWLTENGHENRLKESKWRVLFAAAALLIFLPIFGPRFTNNGGVWTPVENMMYSAFSRISFTLGLAIISIRCFVHLGGAVNTFLSLPIWGPLARLSFAAYLVHPFVIFFFYTNTSVLMQFTLKNLLYYYFSFATLSYIMASGMSLLVEKPFMNLEKFIFRRGGHAARAPRAKNIN